MPRFLLKSLLSTAVFATVSLGAVAMASAAPVTNLVRGSEVQAAASSSLSQPVYYVWRHHHRVWVSRHHR